MALIVKVRKLLWPNSESLVYEKVIVDSEKWLPNETGGARIIKIIEDVLKEQQDVMKEHYIVGPILPVHFMISRWQVERVAKSNFVLCDGNDGINYGSVRGHVEASVCRVGKYDVNIFQQEICRNCDNLRESGRSCVIYGCCNFDGVKDKECEAFEWRTKGGME
ncbi:MAG: hypothetical protein KAR40_06305 [Candidatus Sabulitectum sp.]|nr:hypothetical protein [Candidatus Sabulitectum sp.]